MASRDTRDFLTALSAADVRFVVVGAYALAAHGRVRATGDIDILIAANKSNARRVATAVREFSGVSVEYFGLTVEELAKPRFGFYMGLEPDRIDVLTKIAGVTFDRAWRGRMAAAIERVEVFVIGFDDLIAAKRASSRKRAHGSAKAIQDAADLEWLLAERQRRSQSRRQGPGGRAR